MSTHLDAPKRLALIADLPGDANAALLLGHDRVQLPDGTWRGVMAIDEDNKPARGAKAAQTGAATIATLETRLGPLPRTLTSLTPGYGKHRLFWQPDDLVDVSKFVLKRDFGASAGVEILNEGSYIVYPGSELTPSVAERKGYVAGIYQWEDPTAPIAELPQTWAEYLIKLNESQGRDDSGPSSVEPVPIRDRGSPYGQRRIQAAIRYLKTAPLSIKGNNGHTTMFSVCCYLVRRLLLELDLAADLLEEHYNPRLEAAGTGTWSRETKSPHGFSIMERLIKARDTASEVPINVIDTEEFWEKKQTLKEEPPDVQGMPSYPLTDTGNAERFTWQHKNAARYVADWKMWLLWDDRRWAPDKRCQVDLLAKSTVRGIQLEAGAEPDAALQKSITKHAHKSEGRSGRENMVALAKAELAASPDDFDRDPWILNVENGILDLRTGQLGPHRQEAMITRLAPVVYNASAVCPTWDKFLMRVMGGNVRLVEYLQRVAGYSLTGVTTEHALFFSFGDGENGKGSFHNTLQKILGTYACKTPRGFLLETKQDRHLTELANLAGARFALCGEVSSQQRFDEGLVKDLVGEDKISARKLYENLSEFEPTHKLFIPGNHKPAITGTDHGIWRRIRLIPWTEKIKPEEKDKNLAAKLLAEASGILAWAVRGCLEWQQKGLGEPVEVGEATRAYKDEVDPLKPFLDEFCVVVTSDDVVTSRSHFQEVYRGWCRANGWEPVGARRLASCLYARGIKPGGMVREKGRWPERSWTGVRFKTSEERERGL